MFDIKEVNICLEDLRRGMYERGIKFNDMIVSRNMSVSPNLEANNRIRKNIPTAKNGRLFNSQDNVNTINAKSNTSNNNNNHIEYNEEIASLDPYNDTINDSETTNNRNNKKSKTKSKKKNKLSIVELAEDTSKNFYPYTLRNGEIVKITGKGKDKKYTPIISGIITDYIVKRQYGDNGNVIHEITLIHERKTYTYEAGSTEEIRNWLCINNFGNDKKMVLKFLNDTLMTLRNKISTYGILGGFRRLEDIKRPKSNKPAKYLNNWIKTNLGEEQLTLFKSLILLPFHSIIRNDEDSEPRGLIRAIIAQGDSDQLKSFIVNFYINCFSTHATVSLADNRSSDSFPALRNDCHNHTGILMCDEADELIVDWTGGGKLVPEAVNFIKRMEQSRSINVADLNNQGRNMGSLLNSTPVFIWNEFIEYIPAPLNDRLLLCEFHKENKPKIKQKWKMKQGKKQMVLFGEHISWAFHECYEDIKTMDTETATNTILQYLISEYDYDLKFLIETPLNYTSILQQDDNIRDNIIGALRSYISQKKIDEDYTPASQQLEDNKKFKNHLTYSTDTFLRIKTKSFTDWVNRMVLNGGETTATEIAEMFNWKITKYRKVKVFEVDRIQIGELLDLNKKHGEEDKQ